MQRFHLEFNDFDHFASLVAQGDIRHAQLSKGNFKGSLTQVVHPKIMVSCHRMNQTILQEGTVVKGFVSFLLPGNRNQDFVWRKGRLKGNVIGILKDSMEHSSVTISNFFGTPISIESEYLTSLIEEMDLQGMEALIENNELVRISWQRASELQQLVVRICQQPKTEQRVLTEILPRLLLRALEESQMASESIGTINRLSLFRKGFDMLKTRLDEPVSIQRIAIDLGVSERNLRYAFKENTGMSPKAFFNRYRLNLVRHSLKESATNSVLDSAMAAGFWHSGQFAADYRKLFNEAPSDTLHRTQHFH